ncbi:hypothetical protein QE250_12865 [Chromatiaceae bacterium AAb-1]|nr:hypothetical protein [Chromatiaceae bacterium AAb-1]
MAYGFGERNPVIAVYVENRPPMPQYQDLQHIQALQPADIDIINSHCGNGWRKLFNVYAKLLFALHPAQFAFSQQAVSWQQYRDQHLLQQHSGTALLFSLPDITGRTETIHLIAGRTYARKCLDAGLNCQFEWLSHEFAIDRYHKVLVSPYFDYRQLTNEKITYLAALMASLEKAA